MEYKHFPTTFATTLMSRVGLYHADIFSMGSEDKRFDEADKFYGCIQDFQKLALFNEFEKSLVAYHGIDLNEDQKAALLIVHESSRSWALGHIAEILMMRLEDDPKQVGAIAQTLLEQFSGDGGSVTPTVKKLIINLSKGD